MVPAGIEDGSILTGVQRPHAFKDLVQKVKLEGRALKIYLAKKALRIDGPRLQAYCSTPVTRLHGATRAKILSSKKQFAPKLLAIAERISHTQGKCLVMVDRGSYELMAAILQDVGTDSRAPFRTATMEHLSEFNHSSNARGETHRVFLGDSRDCSEGVSFVGVRQLLLTDVPQNISQLVQKCGRVSGCTVIVVCAMKSRRSK